MTSLIGGAFLAYLLSVSFTEEASQNYTSLSRLVSYDYNLDFGQMIPGVAYNTTITARWAIPLSALAPLEGRTIYVKVTATSPENSSLYFIAQDGSETRAASA